MTPQTTHIQPPEPSKMGRPWALVTFAGGTQLAWLINHKQGRDGQWYWLARKWSASGSVWTKTEIKVYDHEIVRVWRNRPRPISVERAKAAHQKRLAAHRKEQRERMLGPF